MRPQLRIIALLIAIALGFLFLSSITGFFTAGGSSWDGKTSVTVAAEQQQITQHVIFSNHKPQNCADGIFIETSGGTPVTFSTFNEVHNIQGFCTETNVRFDNIIYQIGPQPAEPRTPFSIMTGAQATNSITYEIYYGKISAAGEIAPQPQPAIEQPAVAKYGVGGRGGGGEPLNYSDYTNVSSCQNITLAGPYALNTSLTGVKFDEFNCIDIQADNVLLDCNDYSIDYNDTSGTIGLNAESQTNVTIKNCIVTDYENSIYFSDVNYSLITGSVTNSSIWGIRLFNSNYTNITYNDALDNDFGIYLESDSGNNTLIDNNASNSADYGISLYGSYNNLTNNTANNNRVGILLDSSSYNNIDNNTANNNSDVGVGSGIYLTSSSNNNVITNNTVNNNNFRGIYLASSTNNNITNNTAYNDSLYGIHLYSSSNNSIANNTVWDEDGAEIYLTDNCNHNVIDNNTVFNGTLEAILLDIVSSHNNVTKNTVYSNTYGIKINDRSKFNIIANNNAFNNSDGNIMLLYNASNCTVSGNTATSSLLYGVYLSEAITNTTITNNNLTGNEWGIYLSEGSNSTISGNNASSNVEDGIFIYSYSNNNTILNNNFDSNDESGIHIIGSRDNNITNNTAKKNTKWAFYSITSWPVDAINTVTTLEIGSTIVSFKSQDVALRNGTNPGGIPGSYQDISKFVNATNNTADSWLYLNVSYDDPGDLGGIDEGALFMAKKNATAWETNTSKFASSYGVNTTADYVYANITGFGSTFAPLGLTGGGGESGCVNITDPGYHSLTASIYNSTAEDCCINISVSDVIFDGQGFTIDGDNVTGFRGVCVYNDTTALTNVTVKNVTVTDWTVNGIWYNSVQNGSIEDNTARNNNEGIHLENSLYSNITNNNATNNTYDGIHLEGSSNNSITNNNATNNYYGIRQVMIGGYNNFSNNFANNNLYGILVEGNYNDLTNNTANDNYYDVGQADGGYGIHLGSWNTLLNSTTNNNDYYGIFMQSSCNITNSTASNNHQYGIYVYAGSENMFINNTASNNDIWDFNSSDNSYNNSVSNLDIGSTIISFNSKDIALRKGTSPGGEPLTAIGKYVNATNDSADSMLYLNVSYTDSDISGSGVNESDLRISKHNASGWFTDPADFTDGTYDVNLGDNYVYANITNFGSDFAPLGNVSGGGGGGNETNDTGNVNISVEPMLSITFIDNLVDFGTGFVTAGNAYADVDSNDTASGTAGNWTSTSAGLHGWPGNKDVMTLENNGNVKANVSISAGSNATTFIGGTGPDQWYAAEDNESVSCDGIMQTSYTALGTTQTSLCTSLRDNDTTDALNIMFKIRVPSDAPVSAKTNTITLSAVEA